jgi:cytochrome d ubiquinol oxidase subunit II
MSGIALLFGYAVLGSGWLKLKSNVSLQPFVGRSLRVSATAFAVFFGIACIYAVRIQPSVRAQWASHGIALACLIGLFIIAAGTLSALPGTSTSAVPFLIGLLLFVVGISGIALIVFPEIVPFSVSLWDASSSSTSQGLVMIGAACVTPVVLAYSAFAYWIFRGKTPENGWEA